jgi:4'-phosphopantetheinyl transferase
VNHPYYYTVMSSPDFSWRIPQTQPTLAPGAVHVWRLSLALTDEQINGLRGCLSSDEAERAARYHFERHGRRFIACRGQVREILARYVNARAADLRFRYSPRGKPSLNEPILGSPVHFNVSNSQDVALCAVALDRELGVDVEFVREPLDFEELAARFFARQEVDVLRSLPDGQRLEAFFHCWTRKEAILKATGTGLAFPLDRVVVTMAPNDPARIVAFDDDPTAPSAWWLESLAPGPGYVGAIASPGGPLEICRWHSAPPDA